MNLQNTVDEIKKLENEYLPKSKIITSSKDKQFLNLLVETYTLVEITKRYSNNNLYSAMLFDVETLYNQILYSFITRNIMSLQSLFRIQSDLNLKLLLCIYDESQSNLTNKRYEQIQGEFFRYIKDDIKKIPSNVIEKASVSILESMFSEYSEIIHDKKPESLDVLSFVSTELSRESLINNKMLKNIKSFNTFMYKAIFPIKHLNYSRFGTVEITLLKNSTTPRRFKKILERF
ncbi:hypothetical protein FC50_GL000909 [Lacticaseibacillus pantheris DSM 15945 = JCM 12539 = NBRC 106106]|uniref:Uncharacterized protein n=1 Tax=Lacticaseibacillus pantheris DSM 15945 = JCM 12539 = NBRC 106106 TaxID=1423783 RepID=A0A0R1TZ37_9LACO|nr:hypothetical protein [Lacticaseibacillus pantheris]KRL86390.1 hypothetical protein FC50_GL000909 [Lacticaseibacillus pantheris DSM 15945 = JCM 12539 = NBRC 106106]